MIDQLKYTKNNFMKQIQGWMIRITPLYYRYIPLSLRQRRNVKQAKMTDVMVLALLCWQVELKMDVQTKFYYFILTNIFDHNELPERSRFNRICNQKGKMLQIIRYHLVHNEERPNYTIIDSIPMPLCEPVRNLRATLLNQYADIGFNSTKQVHYYGFKGSFEVSDKGIVVAYTITEASIHDVKMVKTLVNEYPCDKILADQGYISKQLEKDLYHKGTWLWTIRRSNMEQYPYNDKDLKRRRRFIETVFASLNALFNIEHNKAQSLDGFKTRLEQCLLVDTFRKIN